MKFYNETSFTLVFTFAPSFLPPPPQELNYLGQNLHSKRHFIIKLHLIRPLVPLVEHMLSSKSNALYVKYHN